MKQKKVYSVHVSPEHNLKKEWTKSIRAIKGFGFEGDAHAGEKIQHIYDQGKDPNQPNTKQAHLIDLDLIWDLQEAGFGVRYGDMGENIVTKGVDFMSLSLGTILTIGDVQIQLTGLRVPCAQLETYGKGMMKAVMTRNADNKPVFKNGAMGIILTDGIIRSQQEIKIAQPREWKPLPPI